MEQIYFFFDRSAVDPLWKLSWQEFLHRHGRTRWARGPLTDDGNGSLRSMIAFSLETEPAPDEIEKILERRTLRWTLERSTVFGWSLAEIVSHTPGFAKHIESLDDGATDFVVLLAAAVEAYFRKQASAAEFKAVMRLHYTNPDEVLALTRVERATVRKLMDEIDMKPIYPFQTDESLVDENWAGWLDVADTRRFFALLERLWKLNREIRSVRDYEGIAARGDEAKSHRFQDYLIVRELMRKWKRKISHFERPVVFRSME